MSIRISKQALQSMVEQLEQSGCKGIAISKPDVPEWHQGTIRMVNEITSLQGHHITTKFDVKSDEMIGQYYGNMVIK